MDDGVADSLVDVVAGTASDAVAEVAAEVEAGAGVGGAGELNAGCMPAPIPSISRLAASASFLSHAK